MDIEPSTPLEADRPPPRRPPLLPVVIFAVCLCYFGWRFWESGEHIYALLAGINAAGLLLFLFRRTR
jgi:hypothetical protein